MIVNPNRLLELIENSGGNPLPVSEKANTIYSSDSVTAKRISPFYHLSHVQGYW